MASALSFLSNGDLHTNDVHVAYAFRLVGESTSRRGCCGFRARGSLEDVGGALIDARTPTRAALPSLLQVHLISNPPDGMCLSEFDGSKCPFWLLSGVTDW